jgi:hypothetical protein
LNVAVEGLASAEQFFALYEEEGREGGTCPGTAGGVASHTGAQLWFWEQGLRKYDEKRR